jgi:hypothetical protein
MAPLEGLSVDYLGADLILKEADLESKHLSNESVSTLFKAWQRDFGWDDALLLDVDSPTSVRQVLEPSGIDDPDILELPPLSDSRQQRRPLCTFLNFRGTRLLGSDDSSIPSLEEEEHLLIQPSSYEELKASVSLELPQIDPTLLTTDAKMRECVDKFHQLVGKVRKLEKELTKFERESPTRKKRKISA